MVAADYPFLDLLWSMLIFFGFVIWIWILIMILMDLFSRHDASGWKKAAWVVFVIVLPFLGVLCYLISNSKGMAERRMREARDAQADMDAHIRSVAGGGSAAEIEKAHALLSSGAITQAEFDQIKAKALAS